MPTTRSEAVQATGPAPTRPTAPVASPASAALAARPTRSLRKACEGQLGKPSRDMPRRPLGRLAAPGEPPLGSLVATPGAWTWVNFWAAWCEPCKEELPRLRALQARLTQAKRSVELAFVSLDDDERQLDQFLRAQPANSLRSTFWLREGRERTDWLTDAGLAEAPQLPVQMFVDPKGKVRCIVPGAIEDSDYADLLALLAP